VTPGPGQYKVPGAIGARIPKVASMTGLMRSSSFRIKKTSLADLSCTSIKSEFCSTPNSKTPRKLRRSFSSANLSSTKPTHIEANAALKSLNAELEAEIAALKLKLSSEQESVLVQCEHENSNIENLNLREKLESVEAELEVCKSELRYRTAMCEDIQDDRDKLLNQCDQLAEKGDRVESLKNEVELLTQDNDTLEEEICSLRERRHLAEEELEDVRAKRVELEAKCQEEDAKNIFLHFTQEQLNSQVVSLECVVNSVKQENHLLSRALKKMVSLIREEKNRIIEISEAYTKENADSELEFIKLEKQLKDSKVVELELRSQLGEATVCRQQLQDKLNVMDNNLVKAMRENEGLRVEKEKMSEELEEAARDLEVSENDKTVLKDSLNTAEAEKNGLALDLGEMTKGKIATETKLKEAETNLETKHQDLEEARSEAHEMEMTKVGLEGALASLREEFGQMEVSLVQRIDEVQLTDTRLQALQSRCEEQESLLDENRTLISKMEEVNTLLKEKEAGLQDNIASLQTRVEDLNENLKTEEENRNHLTKTSNELSEQMEAKDLTISSLKASEESLREEKEAVLREKETLIQEKIAAEQALKEKSEQTDNLNNVIETMRLEGEDEVGQKEAEIEDLKQKLMETQIGRDEVEERLLDTQGLVETMEIKNNQTFKDHKEVEEKLIKDMHVLNKKLIEKSLERSELVAINSDLSSQVSESLHAIGNLQERERTLGQRCREYEVEVEILNEVAEGSKNKLKVAEEEISSLQGELEASLQEIGEMEAAKIQLSYQVGMAEEDLEAVQTSYTQVLEELTETKVVGRELYLRVQELETSGERQEQETNSWQQAAHDKEQEVLLVRDQVNHLESLRDNLELNVSEKTELLSSIRDEMNAIREEAEQKKARHEETHKTNLRLKGNLEQHQDELRALRQQIEEHKQQKEQLNDLREQHQLRAEELAAARQELEQVRQQHHVTETSLRDLESKTSKLETLVEEKAARVLNLEAGLDERAARVQSLETDREEKERIRMKDMDMLIQLREVVDRQTSEIAGLTDAAQRGESAQRSMEAQQRVLCEAEGRTAEAEETIAAWQAKMAEAEALMAEMETRLEAEEAENSSLREMIEPFKDQLESFEIEKNNLLSQSTQAQDEVKKLATQYGKLLGHQNQKQKIQHVVKIKQESVELKSEIASLKEHIAKQKKTISRLEDKLNEATGTRRFDPRMSFQTPGGIRNKENSVLVTPLKDKSMMSTPMGPPTKARNNSRSSSIGSPLKNKN